MTEEIKYPKWIGRRDYAPPPRCPKCKRLIAFNSENKDVPCKCKR